MRHSILNRERVSTPAFLFIVNHDEKEKYKWQSSRETIRLIGMFPYFDVEFNQDQIGFNVEGTMVWSHKNDSFEEVVEKINRVIISKIGNTYDFEIKLATETNGSEARVFYHHNEVARILDKRPSEIKNILRQFKGRAFVLSKIKKAFPESVATLSVVGLHLKGQTHEPEKVNLSTISKIRDAEKLHAEIEVAKELIQNS